MNRYQGQTVTPRSNASSSHVLPSDLNFSGLVEIGAELDDKIDSVTRHHAKASAAQGADAPEAELRRHSQP